MTLRELEEYRMLKNEVVQITESLERLGNASMLVFDSIRSSSSKERIIPVIGISPRYMTIYNKRKERLENHIKKLLDKLSDIEDFVQNIEKSEIRQIIELRYIRGLTWRKTAEKVYNGYASEDTPRKAIKQFFKVLK